MSRAASRKELQAVVLQSRRRINRIGEDVDGLYSEMDQLRSEVSIHVQDLDEGAADAINEVVTAMEEKMNKLYQANYERITRKFGEVEELKKRVKCLEEELLLLRNSKDKSEEARVGVERSEDPMRGTNQHLLDVIMNQIVQKVSDVAWEDVAGNTVAKATVEEAVVLPMLRPDLFVGLNSPVRGVLLYGPPGTGKSMIGRCIASQCDATFFSISASSLGSKWHGESEQLVRILFALAKKKQPSVIFVDEVDSLLMSRTDSESDHNRRIKTELLLQLEGVGTNSKDKVLVVGATNRPQDLDEAARRRFPKRLYIPLPDAPARLQIISKLLSTEKHSLTNADESSVAFRTAGYSGSDMDQLCREAAKGPLRSIDKDKLKTIVREDIREIDMSDFEEALRQIRASATRRDLEACEEFDRRFGSGSR